MTTAGPVDVAIIGAGPAGLTAAYLLSKEGYRVAVIERDPHLVGGISRTVEYKGYRFDIGGHRFFSKSQEVVDLWNEILPDDFIQRPRMSRIYYEGKFYSYPLRAFEALGNLGIWRSDFDRVGGFDETYRGWGYEDSDLVIRLLRAGVHSGPRVRHRER